MDHALMAYNSCDDLARDEMMGFDGMKRDAMPNMFKKICAEW